MPRYPNGRIPRSALVELDSGPLHLTTPKGAAMWYALRRNVQRDYGVTLYITPGKNAYRDLEGQTFARKNACAAGNCNSAAVPGWSSHGGTWIDSLLTRGQWTDAMAFDIGNWADIGKANFYREARKVGFVADGITVARAGHDEPWHIILFDPYGPVPAGLDAHPADTTSKPESKPAPEPDEGEEDMAMKGAVYVRSSDKKNVFLLFNEISGFYVEHSGVDGSYNNPIAQSWETNAWPTITERHAVVIKRSLDAVRRTAVTGSLSVDIPG